MYIEQLCHRLNFQAYDYEGVLCEVFGEYKSGGILLTGQHIFSVI